jgi:hypothetical protein
MSSAARERWRLAHWAAELLGIAPSDESTAAQDGDLSKMTQRRS